MKTYIYTIRILNVSPVRTHLIRGTQIPGDRILYRGFNVYATRFMSLSGAKNFEVAPRFWKIVDNCS
jgi:hypothetical protein